MSDMDNKACIIISSDDGVIDALSNANSTDFSLTNLPSVKDIESNTSTLNENSIIVYDTGVVNNDANLVASDLTTLKSLDPTQVIFVVGEQKTLTEILRTGTQPLIYRAFNKPIHPNQLFLSFGSAHELHVQLIEKQLSGESLTVNSKSSASRQPSKKSISPLVIGVIAIILLLPAAFFLFGGSEQKESTSQELAVTTESNVTQNQVQESPANDTDERVSELNQFAQSSILEGRLISPLNDNALHYYDQALNLDPYDSEAYEGKKSLIALLRQSFHEELGQANFDRSLQIANSLQEIDPFNPSNDGLFKKIEKGIAQHISKLNKSGNQKEIKRTSEILSKIESSGFSKSKTAIEALKVESDTLSLIDQALDTDNLIPSKKDNAFTVISKALKSNTVTRSKLKPRIKDLHNELVALTKISIDENNLDEANNYAGLIAKLNYNSDDITELAKLIQSKTSPTSPTSDGESTDGVKQVVAQEVEEVKIIPAKITSRTSPKYPKRAVTRNIQGWVDVGFTINESGVPVDIVVNESLPVGVFEAATIKAVKKWRFSPARNDKTGQPVTSIIESTKLHFKLEQ